MDKGLLFSPKKVKYRTYSITLTNKVFRSWDFKSYFSPNGNALRFFNSAFGLNKKHKEVRQQTSHGISKGRKFPFCYTLKVLLASCQLPWSLVKQLTELWFSLKKKKNKNIWNFFLRVYLSSITKQVFFTLSKWEQIQSLIFTYQKLN